MRAIVWTCVLGASMAGWFGPARSAACERRQIVWYRDYELALHEAKLLRRPLLVHVTSKWSPACLRLERTTFIDPKLAEFVNNALLAVYVDADASPDLVARLHAETLPVAVVLSPDGRELARIEGYRTAESYIAQLSTAAGRPRSDASPSENLARGSNSSPGLNAPVRPKATLSGVRVASSKPREEHADIRLASLSDDERPRASADTTRDNANATYDTIVANPPVAGAIVMMDGCCPVSMLESKKLVRGDPSIHLEFAGQAICFSSPEQREKFQADAARYLPVLGGLCPVSFMDDGCEKPGQARFGAVFRNRLYLFAGPDERSKFQANPKRYADCDLALEGNCPMCGVETGQLVPGSREIQHVYQRHLYRFDSDEHRRRFAASPQTVNVDN